MIPFSYHDAKYRGLIRFEEMPANYLLAFLYTPMSLVAASCAANIADNPTRKEQHNH